MDQLRKVYQRAIQIPLDNVEQLWQEYERFENGLNHVLVRLPLLSSRFARVTDP